MKKSFIPLCVALAASLNTQAAPTQNQLKLDVIKNIYAVSLRANERVSDITIITPYATERFIRAPDKVDRSDAYGICPEDEMGSIWLGNNGNKQGQKVSFKVLPSGNVQANLYETDSKLRHQIVFVMKCSAKQCLVDDILQYGSSYLKSFSEPC